jgi:Tfp pilus assembly protein PilV
VTRSAAQGRVTKRPISVTTSNQAHGGQDGFTLVDVLVAVVLLAVALLMLASAFPLASYAVHGGMQHAQSAAIVERVFEQMRTRGYAAITTANFPDQSSVAGYPGFSYDITIEENTPIGGARRVTITTSQAAQGGPMRISYVTFFSS